MSEPANVPAHDASDAAPTAVPAPVIDVHAHAMPLPLLQWLAARGLADLSGVDRGVVVLDPAVSGVGKDVPLPLARSMHDPAERISELDGTGVGLEAVSLPPFLLASSNPDARFVGELLARGNEALADYCRAGQGRLLPLASIPVGFPGAAQCAVEALDSGAARGLAIGSRGAGQDLDSPVNGELWAELSARGTLVFLHPSGVPDAGRLADHWLPQLVGYPLETAVAVARLIFSRVLEESPLTLCLAHGGGCLPALSGRLDLGWERKDVARTTRQRPREIIHRLYYDSAVFDTVQLRRLVDDVGADHVLLGTDHPFDLAERDPVGFVRSAGFEPQVEHRVLYTNAVRLLGL